MKKSLIILLFFSIALVMTCEKKIEIEKDYAEVNGTRLYYEVTGTGDPIILIHGNGLDCRMWDDQFGAFAQKYKVIRYDVRGYGKSAKPTSGESYGQHDDLKALLQHLGISKAHICGQSMGSGIAVDFCLAYPNMCTSLISVGPWVNGYSSDATQEMFSALKDLPSIVSEKGTKAAADYWLEGNPVFKNSFREPKTIEKMRKIGYDYSFWHFLNVNSVFGVKPLAANQLENLNLPTLIITAEYDLEACKEVADLMEQKIKHTTKMVVADAGHCMNMDKPSEFNKIVLDFLSDVSNN